MEKLRTWHEFLIEKLADQEEAICYLQVSLEEYLDDGDTPFFLKGLRNVVEAQGGISEVAEQAGIAPQVLSKILSSEDPPSLQTLAILLKALGGRLSIELLRKEEQTLSSSKAELAKSNEPLEKGAKRLSESHPA